MSETAEPTEPYVIEADDVINRLAGITAESPLYQLRAARPEVTYYAQSSYRALLEPDDLGGVSLAERYSIALRVATLTGSQPLAAWYGDLLAAAGVAEEERRAIGENPADSALSPRTKAILRHVDRLSLEPASATAEQLAEVTDAGLGPRDIVTISQLISFLSFQVRTVAGLRLLSEES